MKKRLLTGLALLSSAIALASCGANANNDQGELANQTSEDCHSDSGDGVSNSTETHTHGTDGTVAGDGVSNSTGTHTHVTDGTVAGDGNQTNNSTTLTQTKTYNNERVSDKDNLDYIKKVYGIDNHVFDVITIDRLGLLIDKTKLDQYGDSLIVFANSKSEVAKNAIVKINEKAIEKGIKRIYYFDFILAGEYGVDLWDNPELTWPNVKTGEGHETQVTQAFVDAKNYLLNNTSLSGLENFDADNDVYLFVNRHQAGTSEVVKDVLIENKNDLKEEGIIQVLNTVIDNEGNFIGTNYSDYDYFNNALYRSQATNSYYETYESFKDTFYVRSITYYELRLLLETEGTHNILFSGSWCGDSKAAIALVVEDAAKYGKGEPVYVFDFRLTNGVKSSNQTSIVEAEANKYEITENGNASRNFITGVGYLGKEVIDKLGDFEVGKQNSKLSYVVGGYDAINVEEGKATVQYGLTEQKKFRSPSLFKYNQDAQNPVTDSWVHEVTDYDILYKNNSGVATYQVGDLIDYELASGSLSDQQKAYGRYKLAVFFGAPEITYNAPVINVSEADSSLDSGCGDDNDPIDNLDEATLIPNHGSTAYDVSEYDITIELKEATLPKDAKFLGTTVIKGKALEDLETIALDFRRQKITSITLVNNTTNTKILDNVSAINSKIRRVNDDSQDLQKLYIDAALSKDDEFEITIVYETTTIDNSTTNAEYGQYAEGFNLHVDQKGYTAVGEPFGSTYWFPNNNTPSDGAKYRITLIAPSEYTLISSGVRESNSINSETGKRETVWVISQDTATYQVFATFSKNITTFEQSSGTRSQTLFETKDGKKIPIYIYVNNDIYKENRYKVERFIGLLPQYIKTLEELFGSYQGESLGFIFENVGDGHGESATWGAIETKDRPFFTNTSIVGENTFVHEFVHQWYGDAVRIENWDNLWLNEGFATYGTSLFYEEIKDDYNANSTYKNLYDSKNETSKLWEKAPAALELESDLFGGQKSAYNRGALALDILRNGIGDDAFFDIIKTWISEYKGTARTTEDFIALVKSKLPNGVSESDIDSFKNVWLYGTAKPANYTLTGSNS